MSRTLGRVRPASSSIPKPDLQRCRESKPSSARPAVSGKTAADAASRYAVCLIELNKGSSVFPRVVKQTALRNSLIGGHCSWHGHCKKADLRSERSRNTKEVIHSHMAQGRGNQGGSQKRDSQGQFTGGSGGNKGNQGGGSGSGGSSNRSEAARKGGEAVSRDREHMSEIGRKGGKR